MTDDLNREIAELLGCEYYAPKKQWVMPDWYPGLKMRKRLPDFTGSLDALRPVYDELSAQDRNEVCRIVVTTGNISSISLDPQVWSEALRYVLKERQDGDSS